MTFGWNFNDVPSVIHQEQIVEVPQVVYEERVCHQPRHEVQERLIQVPKFEFVERFEYVDVVEYREVPVDKVVEVPEIEYRVREVEQLVPQAFIQEVFMDRYVDVPVCQVQEVMRKEQVPVTDPAVERAKKQVLDAREEANAAKEEAAVAKREAAEAMRMIAEMRAEMLATKAHAATFSPEPYTAAHADKLGIAYVPTQPVGWDVEWQQQQQYVQQQQELQRQQHFQQQREQLQQQQQVLQQQHLQQQQQQREQLQQREQYAWQQGQTQFMPSQELAQPSNFHQASHVTPDLTTSANSITPSILKSGSTASSRSPSQKRVKFSDGLETELLVDNKESRRDESSMEKHRRCSLAVTDEVGRRLQAVQAVRDHMPLWRPVCAADAAAIFDQIDTKHQGVISKDAFDVAMSTIVGKDTTSAYANYNPCLFQGSAVSARQASSMFDALDRDGDGYITKDEFARSVYGIAAPLQRTLQPKRALSPPVRPPLPAWSSMPAPPQSYAADPPPLTPWSSMSQRALGGSSVAASAH